MTGRRVRLGALGAVVALAVAAQVSGLGGVLTDRERVERLLTDTGAFGPALFVVLFALSHPVGLPSVALTFVAGIVWPAPLAVALAWTGGMGGALVAFSFARWIGREWVAARLPDRFRRLERHVERRGFMSVVVVRLVAYLPPPADWVFGVSSIRLGPFAAGTAVGLVPPTVVIVLLGDRVTEWLGGVGAPALAGLAAAGVLAGVFAIVVWRGRRRPPALRTATPGSGR